MSVAILVDVVGWCAALMLLLAYGMVSTRKVTGESTLYQVLNLAGGAGLILNSGYHGAYPSVVVNVIWIGIAIVTLVRIGARKR